VQVFVPRALAEAAQLDQTMTVDQTMIPSGGSAARAPARLGGSIIEDANNTLV